MALLNFRWVSGTAELEGSRNWHFPEVELARVHDKYLFSTSSITIFFVFRSSRGVSKLGKEINRTG